MAALFATALAVSGCSTSITDLPSDAPQRPKEARGYLPVHDIPPDRGEAALKPKEQEKIEADLIAARDQQAAAGAAAK
ncbi:hypothetical protein [Bradyrhizobium sp. JYMT SZCCT0428]|uniref:hypothetical protein n=1 Tax=Bradyrhizobium sp. JYMT SZCCT0428 TaxID=2807673 RepID=UPI00289EF09F|nr:hypothetical protein [Bradyrhizobium sp. JYMT SZCCT0428]